MKVLSVQVPDDWADKIDELADEHDTSRAAVLRNLIDNGFRVRKYYPDEFPLTPERFEEADAVELAKEDRLPR